MVDVIRVVSGDGKPTITLTLTDEVSGFPIDLSAGTTTVSIKFRLAGTTTLISTIPTTLVDAVNGIISFDFTGGALVGLAAGQYEGEIEIDFNGVTQTIYEPLKFRVRDEF